jgi:cytidine deaminase
MKLTTKDKQLIEKAKAIIRKSAPVKLADTGDVGSSLITSKGNIYSGVCIGHSCGIGSCAEYQAIGTMISNGEKEIKTIVAIYHDEETKKYEIISPCGKCREMMKQTSKNNYNNTEVIISESKKVKLKELLPNSWGDTIER